MNTLQADPPVLNEFCNKTTERLVGENATNYDVLLLSHIVRWYVILTVSNYEKQNTMKCLKSLQNDCSTSCDYIPVLTFSQICSYTI